MKWVTEEMNFEAPYTVTIKEKGKPLPKIELTLT